MTWWAHQLTATDKMTITSHVVDHNILDFQECVWLKKIPKYPTSNNFKQRQKRNVPSETYTNTHLWYAHTSGQAHNTQTRHKYKHWQKKEKKDPESRLTWGVWWKGVGVLLLAWLCLETQCLLPRPTCHLSAGHSFPVTLQCWRNPAIYTDTHTILRLPWQTTEWTMGNSS